MFAPLPIAQQIKLFRLQFLYVVLFAVISLKMVAQDQDQQNSVAENPDPNHAPRLGSVSGLFDGTRLPNGEIIFLTSSGPQLWNAADQAWITRYEDSKYKLRYFHKMFLDEENPAAYFGISFANSDRSKGIDVFHFDGDRVKKNARIGERLRKPNYFQSATGEMFVSARNGVIYRYSGKPGDQPIRYGVQLPASIELDDAKVFRPIEFADWKDGTVCCYSIVDPQYGQHALYDVVVTTNHGWKTISLEGRATGPACMTAPRQLTMLQYDRWIDIDLDSDRVSERVFATPTLEGAKLKPIKLFRLPDGSLMSLWRKLFRSYMPYDVEPFDDGNFHKIAVWKDNKWQFEIGKDRLMYQPQLHVFDSQSELWMSTCEGTLLNRTVDGEWREFDFRHGVCINGIDHIRCDSDDQLWVFNTELGSFNRIDLEELKQKPISPDSEWTTFYSRTNANDILQGEPYPILILSNQIAWFGRKELEIVDLPGPDLLGFFEGKVSVSTDSKGLMWVSKFADLETKENELFRYDGENWQKFVATMSTNDEALSAIEVACQSMLKQNYSNGDAILNAVFGPENQIAAINTINKGVSYFDGEKWYLTDEIEFKHAPREIDFVDDSVVITFYDKTRKRMPRDSWKDEKLISSNRNWQDVTNKVLIPVPSRKSSIRNDSVRSDKEKAFANLEMDGTQWKDDYVNCYLAASRSELAFNHGGYWVRIPIENTPLQTDPEIRRMGIDAAGRWVFETGGPQIFRIQVYSPPEFVKQAINEDLGSIDQPGQELNPKWETDPPLRDLQIRYRIDDGEWSKWMARDLPISTTPIAPAGRHELALQFQSPTRPIAFDPLVYHFEVKYDLTGEIKKLVEQLGGINVEKRDDATRKLDEFGPYIKGILQVIYDDESNPEIRTRLAKILMNR